jgi:hypothetical protein
MTALNPTIPVAYPRSPSRVPAAGPIWAALQCVLTLGLLPLLLWPTRWLTFAEGERRQLLDIANGWRRHVVGRKADELDTIVFRLRPKPMLLVMCWLVVGFNLAMFCLLLLRAHPPGDLFDLTFGHNDRAKVQTALRSDRNVHIEPRLDPPYWEQVPPAMRIDMPVLREPEANFYQIWLGTLMFGFICHWYAVRSHAVAVKDLLRWTNGLAKEHSFNAIDERPTQLGLNLLWIIIAISFCANAAWWAIPMVLAGAMQRRYVGKTSPAVLTALADQAHIGFSQVKFESTRRCAAARCGAKVPGQAKFCPRCGAAV